MATASITSTVSPVVSPTSGLNRNPKTDHSRDDLEIGDVVSVTSAAVGTTYSWSLAYSPPGSTATLSGVLGAGPHTFTVDKDGPYLIRLQFTDGTGVTEQFVRLRALTSFGSLGLVAAGERYDTLPIPVDITAAGWADEQNENLLTILGYLKASDASTRTLYVDPEAGDYNTIQAAMDAANAYTPSPTPEAPWVVLVRPGSYSEDLTFYPWVNLVGWPDQDNLVKVLSATTASHAISLGANEKIRVVGIRFEQSSATANPLFLQGGHPSSSATFSKCKFTAQGNTGECYSTAAITRVYDSKFVGGSVNPTDYAVSAGEDSDVVLSRCSLEGASGILVGHSAALAISDCTLTLSGTYGVRVAFTDVLKDASKVFIEYSTVRMTAATTALSANISATGSATTLDIYATYSGFEGAVEVDGTNVAGGAFLVAGALKNFTTPPSLLGGAVLNASVSGDSIYYDNTRVAHAPPLTASHVQEALDEIYTYAQQVRTLDDAYDGGDPGPTGSGRVIVADAGAVQILDAPAPSDPIPAGNSNGQLEVVGSVNIGGISKPEIELDPNPFGNGPEIILGNQIYAADAPFGSTALILGNATGTPLHHNYNVLLGSRSVSGGDWAGDILLRGGDSFTNSADGASVYIQAGSQNDAGGGVGGDLYLAPGDTNTGTSRSLFLVHPETATSATLTAAGAWVGGVAGTITFNTQLKAVSVTFTGAENLPATLALFNAEGFLEATEVAGVITLTTAARGARAEVFYISADAGLDASLGVFNGQVMVPGSWPDTVEIKATGDEEISIGPNGAVGPMIYNANTGKLTVPGLIDPTGMIFEEAGAPGTGTLKGAVFVSDGLGALNKNHPYYEADDGTLYDLLAGQEGSATIKHSFSYNTASPIEITDLAAGDTVIQVFLKIETPFDDANATITVGSVSLPSEYLAAGDSDPTQASTVYESTPVDEVLAPENLIVTISPGASTQGTATLIVVIHRVSSTPAASTVTLATAGTNLQKGQLLTAYYDVGFAEVRVKKADADSLVASERTIYGVAGNAAITGAEVTVSTIPGVNVLVLFDVAPATSDIGKMVYLSTTAGEATLSAPGVSGATVFRVGFLYSETSGSGFPVLTLQPQFIAEVP